MKTKKWIALFLALLLCLGIMPAAMAADADVDTYPVRFDLRDYGVVTSVKRQNPWNSCWSFGGIAATESSILTTLGLTTEEYKEQTGEDFDLSEKHLAWYAVRPITELTNPSQAGEGLYPVGGKDDQNAVYNTGGHNVLVTSLFSSAVGPVPEHAFPYQGAEGLTTVDLKAKYPEVYREIAIASLTPQLGVTPDQLIEKREEDPDTYNTIVEKLYVAGLDENITPEELTAENVGDLLVRRYDAYKATQPIDYSEYDDWTIPDVGETVPSNRDVYAGYTLVDGNILPDLTIKDGERKWVGINDAGTRAVKSELLKGRGVSIAFKADTSQAGQAVNPDGYLNLETWAHYTHEDGEPNHAVCIVGWDDTYAKENFKEGHQPPADGAWLVKNSWGSETDYPTLPDGTPLGKNAWGIVNDEGLHTGYFYISYYDKSLKFAESMVFDTDLYALGGETHIKAYDFMPSYLTGINYALKVQEKDVIKTANVFENTSEKELNLYGVSTKAAGPRARVRYNVYRLNENAETPEDGELIESVWAFYEYAGFHREKLNGLTTIKPGERFSIVVTESTIDKNGEELYEYATNQAVTKEFAEAVHMTTYGIAVVNKGESFLYTGGKWIDWSEYEVPLTEEAIKDKEEHGITDSPVVTDNFSIKAYLIYNQETAPQE